MDVTGVPKVEVNSPGELCKVCRRLDEDDMDHGDPDSCDMVCPLVLFGRP